MLTAEQIDRMVKDSNFVGAEHVYAPVFKALAAEVERLKKCSSDYDPNIMHDLECNAALHKPSIYSRAIEFIRHLQAVVGAGDTAMRQMQNG